MSRPRAATSEQTRYVDRAVLEGVERGHAGALVHVAMQGADGETVLFQALVNDGDIALAIAEDDGVLQPLGFAQQAAQGFALVAAAVRGDQELGDGGRGGGGAGDLHASGIMQELLGQPGDFRRHGRREEQGLPGEGHQLADFLDVRDEAHVEHAVGLVNDEDLDAAEHELAAFEKVEQAARRRDQHVDAAHDLGFLVAEGDAADQQSHVQLVLRAIFDETFLDLGGEFARRFEDEGARHAGAGAALFEPAEHGQHEGCGLAGAGLRDAEDVAVGEREGNGLRLNGRGGGVAGGFDGAQHFFAEAEFGKLH